VLLPNEPIVTGKDNILAAVKPMMADPNFALQFQPTKADVAKSGELGYTQGTYTMTMTDPKTKQPMTDKGKYVTVYKKQADGSWKAVSDIINSDLPLPGSEPTK
jgi:ketosteroid isomerase-like protein